jgi:hypothetical protein
MNGLLKLRDWIKSTRIPWVATKNALHAEEATFERTVFCYGFGGVFGTTREKTTTTAEKRTNQVLIDADQGQE